MNGLYASISVVIGVFVGMAGVYYKEAIREERERKRQASRLRAQVQTLTQSMVQSSTFDMLPGLADSLQDFARTKSEISEGNYQEVLDALLIQLERTNQNEMSLEQVERMVEKTMGMLSSSKVANFTEYERKRNQLSAGKVLLPSVDAGYFPSVVCEQLEHARDLLDAIWYFLYLENKYGDDADYQRLLHSPENFSRLLKNHVDFFMTLRQLLEYCDKEVPQKRNR